MIKKVINIHAKKDKSRPRRGGNSGDREIFNIPKLKYHSASSFHESRLAKGGGKDLPKTNNSSPICNSILYTIIFFIPLIGFLSVQDLGCS